MTAIAILGLLVNGFGWALLAALCVAVPAYLLGAFESFSVVVSVPEVSEASAPAVVASVVESFEVELAGLISALDSIVADAGQALALRESGEILVEVCEPESGEVYRPAWVPNARAAFSPSRSLLL